MTLVSYFTPMIIAALVFIPLERILALRSEQGILRKQWQLDATYLLLNGLWIRLGLAAIITATGLFSAFAMPEAVQEFISSRSIWVQVPLTLLVADIGFYAAHRAFHRVPLLWKFHAVHHSIEKLDWLAGHRVHPLDQICTKGASYVPVIALGFSTEAVAVFAVIYMWQSLLLHSNTRIGFGPLEWIIAAPRFHHWHHAHAKEALDRNFAGQLSFLDALFGSLHLPRAFPSEYGTSTRVPGTYLGQLAFPMQPDQVPKHPVPPQI